MDAIFGMSQGLATVLLGLGLATLVLGLVLLVAGRKRRSQQRDGRQRKMIAIALVVVGAVVAVPAAVSWVTALTSGG
jgi:hypothetical protein